MAVRPSPLPVTVSANHLFVNNVRFWSMVAIIAVHSLIAWPIAGPGITHNLQLFLLQTMKFGTIGFYLISGFLLGERLDRYSATEYLWRRIRNTGAPWGVWALFYAVLPLLKAGVVHDGSGGEAGSLVAQIGQRSVEVLFFSTYWFVPNFLFALACILLFKRYLDDLRFGAALFGMSLFYGINVYGQWLPGRHTAAVFGFIFYLWLGNWAARHSGAVFSFIDRVTWRRWLFAVLLTGNVALGEACLLRKLGSEDIVNTLRISNQIFSILIVLGLTKIRRATWPGFINVRAHTFGLFLIHPVLALTLHSLAVRAHLRFFSEALQTGPLLYPGIWAATFFCYYAGSLALTWACTVSPKTSWLVGQWAVAQIKSDAVSAGDRNVGLPALIGAVVKNIA